MIVQNDRLDTGNVMEEKKIAISDPKFFYWFGIWEKYHLLTLASSGTQKFTFFAIKNFWVGNFNFFSSMAFPVLRRSF